MSADARAAGRSRAQRLLDAPALPAIATLAAPGAALAVFQIAASIADTFYVGRLGTDSLAALALVFPMLMLLQMASAGAMGGGVSSAIARALGAGDEAAARRLVVQAIAIALAAGVAFAVVLIVSGEPLYRLLGGGGGALSQAVVYSNVLFGGGAIVVWLANTLASVLRGSGNTFAPAAALALAALVQIALAGALTLGWGPFPAWGIAGTATATVAAYVIATGAMVGLVARGPLRPRRDDWVLSRPAMREILRVGAVSTLSSLQTVLTIVLLTGFVGRFGDAALAGYGVGARLELLLVPLVFAIGQALVVLVGVNIGAGRPERAKRIAWTGTAFAALVSAAIAIVVTVWPQAWIGIFSNDPAVHDIGSAYLRIVAPFYPLFAAGQALYFASQGAGRIVLPILAGTTRLVLVAIGGAAIVALAAPVNALFAVIALGIAAFGGLTVLAVRLGRWGK